jgi:hypothetical protein
MSSRRDAAPGGELIARGGNVMTGVPTPCGSLPSMWCSIALSSREPGPYLRRAGGGRERRQRRRGVRDGAASETSGVRDGAASETERRRRRSSVGDGAASGTERRAGPRSRVAVFLSLHARSTRREQVALVHHEHEGPAFIEHAVRDRELVPRERLSRVQQQRHDVRVGERAKGLILRGGVQRGDLARLCGR